jgi:hypothetical protein
MTKDCGSHMSLVEMEYDEADMANIFDAARAIRSAVAEGCLERHRNICAIARRHGIWRIMEPSCSSNNLRNVRKVPFARSCEKSSQSP